MNTEIFYLYNKYIMKAFLRKYKKILFIILFILIIPNFILVLINISKNGIKWKGDNSKSPDN
jgi:hypothetical protein